MKKKIKFREMNQVEYVLNDGFFLQWCCKCHARHIWHFHIVRGKKQSEDFIVISGCEDVKAEELRKAYEKKVKK